MKIAAIDIETTGLNANVHEIIEIACIIFDSETFEVEKTFETKVMPAHPENIEKNALLVNGYIPDEWKDALPLRKALLRLSSYVGSEKYFCAHNAAFDWSFLSVAFHEADMTPHFNKHKICTMSMAHAKYGMPLSLKELCAFVGIDPEPKVHRAMAGAVKCYQVYREMMK